jgi:prepilin-type N-terminal cleavage/methylation domain-containing protein
MNEPACNGKAFTLVELLAVILVISILAAVVVGVANQVWRKSAEEQTKLHMRIIMMAVDVYARENGGEYPPEPAGADDTAKSIALYGLLKNVTAARARLLKLPPEATVKWGLNWYFVDGFGKVLRYHAAGVGGTPYLESAGADGGFEAKEDNIRSDRL